MNVLKSVHRIVFAGDKIIEPNTVFEPEDEEQSQFFLKHGSAIEADEGETAIYQQKQASVKTVTKAPSKSSPVVAAVATADTAKA